MSGDWRMRNECKHQDVDNPFETFKVLFNKWYISLTETLRQQTKERRELEYKKEMDWSFHHRIHLK